MRHLSIKSKLRRTFCTGFALSALRLQGASAQSQPNKPIKFVVSFCAGKAPNVSPIGDTVKEST